MPPPPIISAPIKARGLKKIVHVPCLIMNFRFLHTFIQQPLFLHPFLLRGGGSPKKHKKKLGTKYNFLGDIFFIPSILFYLGEGFLNPIKHPPKPVVVHPHPYTKVTGCLCVCLCVCTKGSR